MLLGYFAVTSEGAVRGMTALGGVVTVITGAVAAIGVLRTPTAMPPVRRGTVRLGTTVLLMLDLIATVATVGWGAYQANHTVDVTSGLSLSGAAAVRPGEHATLDLALPQPRRKLEIFFEAEDHNREIGSCVPNTQLLVTPVTAGNRGRPSTTSPGSSIVFSLPQGAHRFSVEIVVRNIRGDRNCAVDLSVSSATLSN